MNLRLYSGFEEASTFSTTTLQSDISSYVSLLLNRLDNFLTTGRVCV